MHARYAMIFGRGAARHSARERAAAAGLTLELETNDLLALVDERTPVVAGGDWIAIGRIFDEDGASLADPGPRFLEAPWRCWGNFVLFGRGGPFAYRDPSGSVPAYRLSAGGADIFISDAELALSLGFLDRPEADLDFAVHWLQFPYLRSARAGLTGVSELLPGARLRREAPGGWTGSLGWTPWTHARASPASREFEHSAAALRDTVVRAIAAQCQGGRLLLQLSGGLDSSIIAASLAGAGLAFSAITFATSSADGDERQHARAIAAKAGIRLEEIHEDDLDSSIRPPAERKFRPGSNPVLAPIDDAIERHRRECGAKFLLDGGGGDNLFCSIPGAAPVLDALCDGGPGRALKALGDIAERTGCNLWEAAAAAARRAAPAGWWRWSEDRRFLAPGVLLPGPDRHPWLQAPHRIRPGKREHVASLVHIQHFLDRRATAGSALLHPLMAQPLVELCLAIPSWAWQHGGIDRAVARSAFRGLVPTSILERRAKGSLIGLFHRFFARRHAELEELLLSGRLAEAGIIDCAAVRSCFANRGWANDDVQMRLSEMAALELWLQSWSG